MVRGLVDQGEIIHLTGGESRKGCFRNADVYKLIWHEMKLYDKGNNNDDENSTIHKRKVV